MSYFSQCSYLWKHANLCVHVVWSWCVHYRWLWRFWPAVWSRTWLHFRRIPAGGSSPRCWSRTFCWPPRRWSCSTMRWTYRRDYVNFGRIAQLRWGICISIFFGDYPLTSARFSHLELHFSFGDVIMLSNASMSVKCPLACVFCPLTRRPPT